MKNPEWKQPTPTDQYVAIISSLEGHTSNWQEGIIDNTGLLVRLLYHLEQLKELEPYLRGNKPWQATPSTSPHHTTQ